MSRPADAAVDPVKPEADPGRGLDIDAAPLLRGLVHDLRAPILSMRAGLYLADRNGEANRDLHVAVDGMAARIEELHAWVTLVDGSKPLQPRRLDLRQTASAAARRHAESEGDRAVSVAPGADVQAECDPALMEQALDRLLDNASARSMPGEPVVVHLREDEEGVHVAVHDQGPAPSAADAARAFQPFAQLPRRRNPRYRLGLAHVAAVVHRHGGRCLCWSDDEGTTFGFTLAPVD